VSAASECAHPHDSIGDAVHRCPNCGAPAPGRYCPQCGQEMEPDAPDLRAYIRDRLRRHLGGGSQFWATLQFLLRPGALTMEYIRGRRVRYLRPTQLYLLISVIVFGASRLFGLDLGLRFVGDHGLHVVRSTQAAADSSGGGTRLLPVQIILDHVDTPAIRRFSAMPAQQRFEYLRTRRTQYVSSFLLFLVPVFALTMGLFFRRRRRRFAEHLVFGLHCQSFLLLVLLAEAVVPAVLANILSLWFVGYFCLALHRVYACTWPATLVRAPIMLALYFSAFFALNLVLVFGLISM
jgi:hypothetical protein